MDPVTWQHNALLLWMHLSRSPSEAVYEYHKTVLLGWEVGAEGLQNSSCPWRKQTPPHRFFSRPIRNLITTPSGKAPLLKPTIKRIWTYGASCVIQNLSACPVFSTTRKRPYRIAQKRYMTLTVSLPGNRLVHKVVTRRRHDTTLHVMPCDVTAYGITCNALWCHGLWHFPHISFLINKNSIFQ